MVVVDSERRGSAYIWSSPFSFRSLSICLAFGLVDGGTPRRTDKHRIKKAPDQPSRTRNPDYLSARLAIPLHPSPHLAHPSKLTSILLRKPRTDPLAMLHKLVHTVGRTDPFFPRQSFGREIRYTGVEASFDEPRVEFHEILHLFLFDDL